MVKREMAGALADLLDARDALFSVARAIEYSALKADDARIALLAGELAVAVDKLVSGIPAGEGMS